ncbi:MAG: hypothetical protein NC310_01270 [Roseburia sp.]|nr:hypothetical protein [Anaeroplasma bactoclasticum]MCM1195684.1 hypothetical protein [Roseburia sp.]MCM1556350.1 hypothetical protein [Anaeroplasma bactoclasticum]
MRVGKRLFPYPLLNNNPLYSQYRNSSISFKYNEVITKTQFILDDIQCNIDCKYLTSLIEAGYAQVVLVVECAQTMLRKHYIITNDMNDIKIPLMDVSGKVDISLFVVAIKDIPSFKSNDFLAEYSDYEFYIEKNDILAVDDGYTSRIEFNEDDSGEKSSIFLMIKDNNIDDKTMKVDLSDDKIIISLPAEQWNEYDKTKQLKKFQNLYFSIIAVPALSYALAEMQRIGNQVDNLRIENKWFNAFCIAYENRNGKEITDEIFMQMNPYNEAQRLLNNPVTKALDDIFSLTMTMGGIDDGNQY